MRFKKSIRSRRSARFNKILRLKEFARLPVTIRAGAIAIVVICAAAAVMLIAAHRPSSSARGDKPLPRAAARNAAPPLVADAMAPNAPADSAAKAATPKSAPVTITGCLERDDQTFRLKDTAGANAPKSRSWKTGFLKKSSASIEVVDAANRLKLRDHVGQRISVTGILVDREMQVRSLQRVAASCTNSSRVKI